MGEITNFRKQTKSQCDVSEGWFLMYFKQGYHEDFQCIRNHSTEKKHNLGNLKTDTILDFTAGKQLKYVKAHPYCHYGVWKLLSTQHCERLPKFSKSFGEKVTQTKYCSRGKTD